MATKALYSRSRTSQKSAASTLAHLAVLAPDFCIGRVLRTAVDAMATSTEVHKGKWFFLHGSTTLSRLTSTKCSACFV